MKKISNSDEKKNFSIYDGKKIQLLYGDFSEHLANVQSHLSRARHYIKDNENRNKMFKEMKKFHITGDMMHTIEAQRAWVRDKQPIIETINGFIESYRDPFGVRAEWEGYVAIVNKKKTMQLNVMVERIDSILKLLPWPKEFEKKVFNKPDFTSIDVLSFVGSGIPIGINLPNFDCIRDEDFKNVR